MTNVFSIGSLNMDIVYQVSDLPKPGETVQSLSCKLFPGGKGANQAVAASRSGASVWMIGAVGDDSYGEALRRALQADGVRTETVHSIEGDTGTACITVDAFAENHIVLAAGANGRLTSSDIPEWIWGEAALIMLQNEIPWQVNRHVLAAARERGILVIMNAAPAMHIEEDVLPLIPILAVNETELEMISGQRISGRIDAQTAAESLIRRGVSTVLVTLGSEGSLWLKSDGECLWTPAFLVDPVDTTAAGDTFIGAFAAEYASGVPAQQALRYASAAAALAVTREGAQSSVPGREEVLHFMQP
ncbi:ribokinase [Paenibacillus sp. GCM10012307]|uniref:Ribokinase n=1 Tax=Paenibacillus roseus TaxID=2798579 RepID=A0A934J4I8_9BACL|nr:ribokinase [Paenibacillus roseus]MBJ6361398.1 ribokinase [Paenibacillus roseus]